MKAHKLVLSAVSPVFRKMFFSNNEDQNFTTENEEIEITDSECFAFQNMVNFIYSKVKNRFITIKLRNCLEKGLKNKVENSAFGSGPPP